MVKPVTPDDFALATAAVSAYAAALEALVGDIKNRDMNRILSDSTLDLINLAAIQLRRLKIRVDQMDLEHLKKRTNHS